MSHRTDLHTPHLLIEVSCRWMNGILVAICVIAGSHVRPLAAADAEPIAETQTAEAPTADAKPTAKPSSDASPAADSSAADETPGETGDTKEEAADEEAEGPKAGHSYHGEAFNEGPRQAAYMMQGTGHVQFPVAGANSRVQQFINQGVGQLHGFWFFEAERSFRQAAAIDPECAAAYWGMAMANSNNRDRAKEFIAQAVERKDKADDRVKRYIDALDTLLKTEDKKEASNKYIDALEKIVYDYPDDIEAKAFVAVHLWEGRRNDQKIRSHLAVDALIQQVLDVEPQHPAHHYRIHLWDGEKPARALASAASCGQAAPSIAHMWHMPGHIYSKLHRYADAVWQQEASARTDHHQMMRDQVLPDQIHNFAHNNEWLIRNLIHIGRLDDALDLARNMLQLPRHPKYNSLDKGGCSASYGRKRFVQVLCAAERWDDLIAASHANESPENQSVAYEFEKGDKEQRMQQVEWLRVVGRAYHRKGDDAKLAALRGEIEQHLSELEDVQKKDVEEATELAEKEELDEDELDKKLKNARGKTKGDISRTERAANELKAYEAIAVEKTKEAIELLEKAGDTDKAYLAAQHLRAGNADRAIEIVQKHVEDHPQETIPLANLAWLQWQAGKCDDAAESMKQLRKISAYLDLHAAPFTRLKPLVAHLDWPFDWRVAIEPSDDVGDRPSLDSLGPFRWKPSLASDWTLQDTDGQQRSLADYRGQPVVVIFYLGFGCLHCAEQLHEFAPKADEFRKAGFEIVAISSDDREGLQQSREDFDGDIPFPLMADPELEVFRRYRVFDDFEDQPLHGTFIIDADGLIRWQDISYEPFMDVDFVLREASR